MDLLPSEIGLSVARTVLAHSSTHENDFLKLLVVQCAGENAYRSNLVFLE